MNNKEVSEYALIVQRAAGAQLVLNSLLRLLLNFQYGLQIMIARSFAEADRRLDHYEGQIRCVFVLEEVEPDELHTLASGRSQPFFLLMPEQLAQLHRNTLSDVNNLHYCALEHAFGKSDDALMSRITSVFSACGIDNLLGPENLSYTDQQQRAEQRLGKLHTLPTLPEVVMRIMQLVEDPETTIEDLEAWLIRDPSIVLKLRQILTSPAFAANDRHEEWTLQEAIVRVGLKKVGAIAQQIELMNSLVQPEHSSFNLERFWKHSLACALVANRLCSDRLIPLGKAPDFNAFWMGALLHDIGKLVLGFFFPVRYQAICDHIRETPGTSFRKAEEQLGNVATHDYLARLLLLKSGMDPEITKAVSSHHHPGKHSTALTSVIHIANGLCKDMGFGSMSGERGHYSAAVIRNLNLDAKILSQLREDLQERIADEVEVMLDQCRPGHVAAIATAV